MPSRWSDWSTWTELERPFAVLDELRRQMDRAWTDYDAGRTAPSVARAVAELTDEGAQLKLTAFLPGLADRDVKLQANQDGLTLEATRSADVPEGYSVHRRERASVRLARSFSFPCRVDVEKIQAGLEDGVLTVTLPKVPEAQPRTIAVRAG